MAMSRIVFVRTVVFVAFMRLAMVLDMQAFRLLYTLPDNLPTNVDVRCPRVARRDVLRLVDLAAVGAVLADAPASAGRVPVAADVAALLLVVVVVCVGALVVPVRCVADEYDLVAGVAGEACVLARSKWKRWLRSSIAVVNASSLSVASDAPKSKLVVRNVFTYEYSGDRDPNSSVPMCCVMFLATAAAVAVVSSGHASSKHVVSELLADFTSAKTCCGVVVVAMVTEQTAPRSAAMRLSFVCRAVCVVM